jgi:L-ascorbate metabolism protein UlaG (beta-lactamase superfamily)
MGRPRFHNLDPAHRPRNFREVFRWGVLDRLSGRRRVAPPGPPAPRAEPDLDLIRAPDGPPRLTWIGHASFLATLGGGASLLVDPVFSRRIGVFFPRHGEPGLTAGQLPPLAALLVSHNHYDHLDAPSCRAVGREVPVVAPLGLGRWFRRRGHRRVNELGWWESAAAGPLRVTLVPARHWSRRWIADVNRTLWGGFVVEAEGGSAVYFAGDTADFSGFAEIGRRFPGLLAAVLPIGGYRPAWFMEHNHMNPEQAGRAFLALGARHLVPCHWGTFQLTDEPIAEPAERLREWWRRHGPTDGRRLHLAAVGETVVLAG